MFRVPLCPSSGMQPIAYGFQHLKCQLGRVHLCRGYFSTVNTFQFTVTRVVKIIGLAYARHYKKLFLDSSIVPLHGNL